MTTRLVLASLLLAAPSFAAPLRLPSSAQSLPAAIAATCPDCAHAGYTPCGSPDVQWGTRFAPHAFLGTPRRAYLVTFTMHGDAFRALARRTGYATLVTTLRERFARSRLVVVEDGFASARVLAEPRAVAVAFPRPLHACVHGSERPWACCSDCGSECCEKGLGSPTIALTWNDGDETITFHWNHTIGVAWLDRRAGERRTRYACLTDAKGELRN